MALLILALLILVGCAEALALGSDWVDSGPVFTSKVGTVIEPRYLNRFFDDLIAKAGDRRIRDGVTDQHDGGPCAHLRREVIGIPGSLQVLAACRCLCRSRGSPTPMLRSRWWSRPRQSEEVALTEPATPTGPFSGRTPWSRSLQAPLRAFLQTESGSAGILLLATVAALAWANLAPGAYDSAWEPR